MNKVPPFSQHIIRTIRKDQGAADILYAGLCHLNESLAAMSDEDISASFPFFPSALVRERIDSLVQNFTLVRRIIENKKEVKP